MKYIYLAIIILISLFIVGCPVESKFPLGDSRSAPMDERYVGKWSTESKNFEIQNIWLLPFNENEYYMEINDNKNKSYIYRSFLTIIDNVHILNVQPISDRKEIVSLPDRTYMFLKLSLSDNNNVLELWNIESDGIGKNHSKEELFDYVKKNIGNDKLYYFIGEFKRHVDN